MFVTFPTFKKEGSVVMVINGSVLKLSSSLIESCHRNSQHAKSSVSHRVATHLVLIVGEHVGPPGPHVCTGEVWIAGAT